ncbi:hypothetical protein [Terriglobus sp. TAA 43]|uniref:hypothetical protein n=1 Tax=Terriglobus sp. TAA 43 TaxID=278961 RepID=UPI0006481167|nr:hypothetical protein [Terriglobus sp. TAA 43]
MQSVKDTFLLALRDRLAVVNAARIVSIRGAMRPAVIADDVELVPAQSDPMDCFVLQWLDEVVDLSEPLPLHALQCEVRYATRGTQELAGMDRGRVLAALDAEFSQMLQPRSTVLQDFSGSSVVTCTTRVWWSEMESSPAAVDGDTLQRVAKLTVFALEETEQ